jgi:glycosyltransferase involved in cell wall biosynthesis
LTPQSARDLEAETGIVASAIIFNSMKIPPEFLNRVSPQDEPPLVINVATVQPRKGPDLFIDIAAMVCERHPTVRFVWIGGSSNFELDCRIERLKLNDRIEFIGKVFPPWEWMRRASLMLLTSRSEAFGLSVAEAMACYRTVGAFSGTGAADAVGDTGIVVDQFNTTEMAQRILNLLAHAPDERINDKARERYDELFAPQPFADRLFNAIMNPGAEM